MTKFVSTIGQKRICFLSEGLSLSPRLSLGVRVEVKVIVSESLGSNISVETWVFVLTQWTGLVGTLLKTLPRKKSSVEKGFEGPR